MKRVLLYGPRETILRESPEMEYREKAVKSYEELLELGGAFGRDYTASREFLGIEYLAAALRQAGHHVRVISCCNEGLEPGQGIDAIRNFRPDVLGVSLLYDLQLYDGLTVAREIKRWMPNVHVVFGGPLASVISDLLLATFPYIDSIVRGEGEVAITALVDAIECSGKITSVPGLSWRSPTGITANPSGVQADLDELPLPSRDVLLSMQERKLPIVSAYLATSRGCLAHCTFCTVPRLVRHSPIKYRFRDPVLVVDEMHSLVETFGVTTFYMADDNFLGYGPESRKRLLTLADEIEQRKLKISYHAECRVDSLDEEVIARLRANGFSQILLGLESGSDRTLKRWVKGQTVEQNTLAIQLARRHRFDLVPSMILLDWESTVEELEETVSFIETTRIYDCNYPLSLVNKLKVHCGTAAGQRYENVHGVRRSSEIRSDPDLKQWIIAHTYEDLPIDDPYVAEFWRSLTSETNRLSVLSQEVIPELLMALRRCRSTGTAKLVRACRLWRRSLGRVLIGLMLELVHEARSRRDRKQKPGSLRQLARDFVAAQERPLFSDGLDMTLRNHSQTIIEARQNGSRTGSNTTLTKER